MSASPSSQLITHGPRIACLGLLLGSAKRYDEVCYIIYCSSYIYSRIGPVRHAAGRRGVSRPNHQMMTRRSGATYMRSPGWTENAA